MLHEKKDGYMSKCPCYISVSDQRIYADPHIAPWEFKVEMSREFLPVFERLFAQVNDLEFRNFLLSHLPYIPYHYDQNNHDIDMRTKKMYAIIHEFGDKETKKFIENLPYFR